MNATLSETKSLRSRPTLEGVLPSGPGKTGSLLSIDTEVPSSAAIHVTTTDSGYYINIDGLIDVTHCHR